MPKAKTATKRTIPGINIQWPISELILEGKKTIETRRYPIPTKYIGVPIALIETPGPRGKFKARIRGVIQFSASFEYLNEADFYRDSAKHCVSKDSVWKWSPGQRKFCWPVKVLQVLEVPSMPPKKRGIVFANDCMI